MNEAYQNNNNEDEEGEHNEEDGFQKGPGIAAGIIVALILTGAGIYLFAGEKGRQRRREIKRQLLLAQRKVMRSVEVARRIGMAEYGNIVDLAIEKYGSLEGMTVPEIMQLSRDIKSEWDRIKSRAKVEMRGMERQGHRRGGGSEQGNNGWERSGEDGGEEKSGRGQRKTAGRSRSRGRGRRRTQ